MSGDDGEWLAPNITNLTPVVVNSTENATNFSNITYNATQLGVEGLGKFGDGSIVSLVFFICSVLYFTAHFGYFRRVS